MADRSVAVAGTNTVASRSPRHKHSRLYVGVPGHLRGKKGSSDNSESHKTRSSVSLVENTYKLQPGNQEKFQTETVRKVMLNTLEGKLENVRYDPNTCGDLATLLTNEITSQIKMYQWSRYKLVVQVFVGQKENQGLQVASRCVWNADTDTYACVSYGNPSLFAVASCYAVYYE